MKIRREVLRLFRRSTHTQPLLHTNTFTHNAITQRRMCTPPLLHTDAFTHRRFYSQTVSHTDHFTHRCLYTQTHLHTHTHMRPFTPGPRKLEQMHCHTKKLSHPDPVTYRPCYRLRNVHLSKFPVDRFTSRTKPCTKENQVGSCPHRKTMPRFYFAPMVVPPNLPGFHTASKKSSVPTGLLPASLWSRSRKPCRAAWTGQQEDLSSPQSAAEVHVEPSGWLPCIELSTDRHGAVPIFQDSKIGTTWFFKHQMALSKLRAYAPGICSNFSTTVRFSNMLLQMSYLYLRLSTAIIELPIVVKQLKGSAQQTVLHSMQMKCMSQIFYGQCSGFPDWKNHFDHHCLLEWKGGLSSDCPVFGCLASKSFRIASWQ